MDEGGTVSTELFSTTGSGLGSGFSALTAHPIQDFVPVAIAIFQRVASATVKQRTELSLEVHFEDAPYANNNSAFASLEVVGYGAIFLRSEAAFNIEGNTVEWSWQLDENEVFLAPNKQYICRLLRTPAQNIGAVRNAVVLTSGTDKYLIFSSPTNAIEAGLLNYRVRYRTAINVAWVSISAALRVADLPYSLSAITANTYEVGVDANAVNGYGPISLISSGAATSATVLETNLFLYGGPGGRFPVAGDVGERYYWGLDASPDESDFIGRSIRYFDSGTWRQVRISITDGISGNFTTFAELLTLTDSGNQYKTLLSLPSQAQISNAVYLSTNFKIDGGNPFSNANIQLKLIRIDPSDFRSAQKVNSDGTRKVGYTLAQLPHPVFLDNNGGNPSAPPTSVRLVKFFAYS